MKKLILFGLVLLVFFVPSISIAEDVKWMYIHDGEFVSNYALVERQDFLHKGEYYLVEFGLGCTGLSWGQDKWAIWTGSIFLDGFMDEFIDPTNGNTCRLWEAFPIEDWETELASSDYPEFFKALRVYQ